eukprot:TRINITY_DN31405_c0_g1_i1.p1 TRINITY_DN31405_c0_g1~~TRINITY_DN31405_c0_g1_i1.p1  ORF type:complete len:240 (+),score=24.47 TRINITY_DN31405_c0_g1_i1:49-768(+)
MQKFRHLDLLVQVMYEKGVFSRYLMTLPPVREKLRIAADNVRPEVPEQVMPRPKKERLVNVRKGSEVFPPPPPPTVKEGLLKTIKERDKAIDRQKTKKKRSSTKTRAVSPTRGLTRAGSGLGLKEPPPPPHSMARKYSLTRPFHSGVHQAPSCPKTHHDSFTKSHTMSHPPPRHSKSDLSAQFKHRLRINSTTSLSSTYSSGGGAPQHTAQTYSSFRTHPKRQTMSAVFSDVRTVSTIL